MFRKPLIIDGGNFFRLHFSGTLIEAVKRSCFSFTEP
jgi:hypothetical protein